MSFNEDQPRDERGRWAGGAGWTAASAEPMPEAMRASIADRMYALNARPVANRQAWIALGPPGSGKSSHVEPIAAREGAHVVDPDVAKGMTPGYNGKNANDIHEYSADVSDRVLQRAVERGENVAIPMTGRTPGNVRATVEALGRAGYDVHLSLHDLPAEKSVERAAAREKGTGPNAGRRVAAEYILGKVDGNPRRSYEGVKYHPAVRSYVRFDADVPRGQSPRVAERYERGKRG